MVLKSVFQYALIMKAKIIETFLFEISIFFYFTGNDRRFSLYSTKNQNGFDTMKGPVAEEMCLFKIVIFVCKGIY